MSRFCVRCGRPIISSNEEYCDNCKRIWGIDDRVPMKVIEDIKSEIQELIDWRTKAGLLTEDLQMVLELIDKHIGGDNE